jgi:UDP-GlcNAc3NAcA epimerase
VKIVTVVGARPQFIKAGAFCRAIEEYNRKASSKKRMDEVLVHTGQHYDYLMDKVFFEELELPKPAYHLGVGSGSHAQQTGRMLERLEPVLEKEKPDGVVVYGDTNSTLAGALTAAKLNIPVVHVEAGLRSYVRSMPEEINRIVTDHLSTFLFCPTNQAVRNLAKEGIKPGPVRIVRNVGDVMYDSILYYSKIAEKKSTILKDLGYLAQPPVRNADLRSLRTCTERFPSGAEAPLGRSQTVPYYLVTLHRAENTDDPKKLKSILKALNEIGRKIPILLPLHPRTKKMIHAFCLLPRGGSIKLIDPVSYFDMLSLERQAKAILTDSGGVQKEAYWFRVPCLTLRDETEWVETVKSGWNVLVGTEQRKIAREIVRLEKRRLSEKGTRKESIPTGIFGDGKASEKIVQILVRCSA